MQTWTAMISTKSTNKFLKSMLRSIPEIPYINERGPSVMSYVLGAIGVAVVGGIAAVMIFSPRTRYRALGVAKDAYGKVGNKIGELGIADRLGISTHGNTQPLANGLSSDRSTSGFSTSGL